MLYYFKNKSGNTGTVPKKLYERLQNSRNAKEYELWMEDPYKHIPEGVPTYPINKGNGWFELSDGRKIRDEQKAKQEQGKIDGDIF